MTTGIGIDVLEIERLERALERRPTLARRVFSEREIAFASSRRRPARHLAVRFAAKEAALKALGLGGLRLHEIEVEGGGDSVPHLRLHGSARDLAESRGIELAVSLSHSREIATAVVISSPSHN